MSKKTIDTTAINNELRASLHFFKPPEPRVEEAQKAEPVAEQKYEENTSKLASVQTSKRVSTHTSKRVNVHASKLAVLPKNEIRQYNSYLTSDSISRLKRLAFESGLKDREVLQAAVDSYLAKKGY
jgi:hypothetical protein